MICINSVLRLRFKMLFSGFVIQGSDAGQILFSTWQDNTLNELIDLIFSAF